MDHHYWPQTYCTMALSLFNCKLRLHIMTYFDQAGCVKRLQLLTDPLIHDDSYDTPPGKLGPPGKTLKSEQPKTIKSKSQ